MKIFRKLLILNLVLSAIPILVIIQITTNDGAAKVNSYTQKISSQVLESIGLQLDNFFSSRKNEVKILAQSPTLKSMDWSRIKPFLVQQRLERNDLYEKFILGKTNGHFYNTSGGNLHQGGIRTFDDTISTSSPKTIAKRQYWQVAIKRLETTPYISEPMVSYTTGVQQIVISEPIIKQSKVIGMLGGGISWRIIENKLNTLSMQIKEKLSSDSQLFLVSNAGSYIYHWDEGKSLKYAKNEDGSLKLNDINEPITSGVKIQEESPALAQTFKNIQKRQAVNLEILEGSEKFRYFLLPVQGTTYTLGIKIPSNIFLAPVLKHNERMLTIAVISLLFTTLLSFIFSKTISHRLVSLNDASKAFSQGKFVNLSLSGSDEISDLSRTFDKMCKNVIDKMEIIQATEKDLRHHKENLEKIVQDRTEDLKKALIKAESANKAKGEFVATISHEIRTPMNAILGFAEHLLDSNLDDTQKDQLITLHTAADSLLAIINDILDFSKLENGKMDIESVPFSLEETIDETLKVSHVRAEEKGIKLIKDHPSVTPHLLGDPHRIKQILLNFLSNAIKFTDTGSVTLQTRVKVEKDYTTVKFSVIDTGIGIPQNVQTKLFNRFQQADSSTTRKYGGTGLGLSIVKSLIELMHGTFGLESELEKGSCFWFEVIFQNSLREGKIVQQNTSETVTNFQSKHALVVDDNRTNLKLAKLSLEKAGLDVVTVSSGLDALAYLETHDADIIFMDCLMPEMDGFETTQKIKQMEYRCHIPVIALTANAMKEDKEKCFRSGMDGFLAKPFTKQDLNEVLNDTFS